MRLLLLALLPVCLAIPCPDGSQRNPVSCSCGNYTCNAEQYCFNHSSYLQRPCTYTPACMAENVDCLKCDPLDESKCVKCQPFLRGRVSAREDCIQHR